MTTEQDALNRLEALEARRRACRRRAEKLTTTFEQAANRISDAITAIGEAGAVVPALAGDFETAIETSARGKMTQITAKLEDIVADGSDYAKNLIDVDLEQIGNTTKDMAEAFTEQALDLVDKQIEALVSDAIEDAQERIIEERDTLIESLEVDAERLEGLAEDWKETLTEAKDRLETRLDELANVSIKEAWQEMGDALQEAFANDVLATHDKLLRLKDKVTNSMDKIQTLVEAFGTARKATTVTVKSAGSSLEIISSIFQDLEAIFASVK